MTELHDMLSCSAGTIGAQTGALRYDEIRAFSNWCYINVESLPSVECVFERIRSSFDLFINTETSRRVAEVAGVEHFGVTTAAYINGEFVLVSDYTIADEMRNALEAVAQCYYTADDGWLRTG